MSETLKDVHARPNLSGQGHHTRSIRLLRQRHCLDPCFPCTLVGAKNMFSALQGSPSSSTTISSYCTESQMSKFDVNVAVAVTTVKSVLAASSAARASFLAWRFLSNATASRRVMASLVKMMHRKRRFRSWEISFHTRGFQRPLFYVHFPVKTILFRKDFQVTHPGGKFFADLQGTGSTSSISWEVWEVCLMIMSVPPYNFCSSKFGQTEKTWPSWLKNS